MVLVQLEVLNSITRHDPECQHCCIHLQHWFDYRGHVCIVFEKLGSSLYDFMRRNGYRPFPLDIVQQFARQLLRAIAFLHSLNITHTDLKPENILLVNSTDYTKLDRDRCGQLGCRVPLNPDIRVIDFGSATFDEDRHSTIVSTRHYRAPEVILGLGWSFQCDLWSAGCILVELITGRALFQTHENLEHLAMIERVVQPIPPDMVKRASKDAQRYFHSQRRDLLWEATASRKSVKAVQQLSPLKRLLRLEADSSVLPHLEPLHNLVGDMLSLSPSRRSSARRCLSHDFFREHIRSLLPKADASSERASTATAARVPACADAHTTLPACQRGEDDVQIVAVRSADGKTQLVANGRVAAPLESSAACDDVAAGAARQPGILAAVDDSDAAAAPAEPAKAKAKRTNGGRSVISVANGKERVGDPVLVATRVSERVASRALRVRQDEGAEEDGGVASQWPPVTAFFSSKHQANKGVLIGGQELKEDAPPSDLAEDLPWEHACGASA